MIITKIFRTETSHVVREAFSERCKYNIHGHSYVWELNISGDLDKAGMVVDFGALSSIKKFVDLFDHATVFWNQEDRYSTSIEFFKKNFNRWIVMKQNPTAENMARLLLKQANIFFKKMNMRCKAVSVVVHETITGKATAFEYNDFDIIDELSEELTNDLNKLNQSLLVK